MASSRIPGEVGTTEYLYLVFYRLKNLNDEEKKAWFKSWSEIRRKLPEGMKLTTEATSAFGTEYTGFAVYEGPLDKYEELVIMLERASAPYVEKTRTIIGTTGFSLPTAEIQKIIDVRPVD